MSLEKKMSTPPKWVNPCGLAAETFEGDLDVVQLQDDQLLQQVVVQARTALSHAKLFRDNYVSNRMHYTYFAQFRIVVLLSGFDHSRNSIFAQCW